MNENLVTKLQLLINENIDRIKEMSMNNLNKRREKKSFYKSN